jgi:ADP-L-glycero-D-manno-heptose 6-epimerase
MPESIRDKYQYFTQADIHKLLATAYNQSITSLEDAVRDYVVNYLVPRRTIGASSADSST